MMGCAEVVVSAALPGAGTFGWSDSPTCTKKNPALRSSPCWKVGACEYGMYKRRSPWSVRNAFGDDAQGLARNPTHAQPRPLNAALFTRSTGWSNSGLGAPLRGTPEEVFENIASPWRITILA